jgi:hypothetical protein
MIVERVTVSGATGKIGAVAPANATEEAKLVIDT